MEEFTYDATGIKLNKTTNTGTVKNYVADIEYNGSDLEAIYHPEGRLSPNGSSFYYEYTIRDHLGNGRVYFRENGFSAQVLQKNHYYPFGLELEASYHAAPAGTENPYQYNGKELHEDFGLGWYDYGARWYDPAIGRFTGVDPIADRFAHLSVYNYASNDPISNIDLHGLQGIKYTELDNNGNVKRHVIELQVRVVTVDNWKRKENGTKPKDRVESNFTSDDVKTILSILNTAYNGEKGTGSQNSNGETVFFDITVQEFNVGAGVNVTENDLKRIAREKGTTGINDKIIDQKTGKLIESISGINFILATSPGATEKGINGANITKIRPDLKNDYETISHETGHQLMTRTAREEHNIMSEFGFKKSSRLIDAILSDALKKKN
ncbi:MAG TPA: RHS repeat-associated core domain-containing protein [Saprospiraceae bacterium]|nr:RHS repeat-associated core domain-containing protein [Saprospiraceae bacterium]